MKDVDEAALAGEPFRGALNLFSQVIHKTVAAGRQHESKAKGLASREPSGRDIDPIAELGDIRLDARHRLGAHTLAPVDDAIDGSERDTRRARYVFERGAHCRMYLAARHWRAAHSMPRIIIVLISGTSSS
jgi:hypothetical protein